MRVRRGRVWVRAEPVSTGRIASPNWMRGAAGWWAGRWPPTCGAAFAATPRRAWRSSSSSRAATIGAAPFSTGLPVAGRLRGRPGGGGSMSTPESAIHGARRRQWAPIRVLGADRHPNESHNGPLRLLRTVGGTLGIPPGSALHGVRPRRWPHAIRRSVPAPRLRPGSAAGSKPALRSLDGRLRRLDCSLCGRVTKRKDYLSTKPGQLHTVLPHMRSSHPAWWRVQACSGSLTTPPPPPRSQ